ncbi:MAG: SPASM domain-containing protein [Deltaproteobacteria bacterium]|nr:SPASM domain-containing protein [Deltaproteobacteria bacterium]
MVCTVYHRHNQQRIDEIPEYLAREVGDVDWDFQMIRGTPHEASAAQDVDVSGFFEKKRLHAARVANRPRPTAIERLIAEKNRAVAVMYSENFRRERRRDCRAGTRHAVIRETGEVVSCEIGEFSMGNVRDHGMDLRRLWNAEQAERTRRKIRGDGCACVHDCNLTTDLFFTRAGLSAAAKAFFPEALTAFPHRPDS